MNFDTTRRGFLELFGASSMALGGSTAQLDSFEGDDIADFDAYGVLLGPEAARPAGNGDYLAQYDTYRLIYFASDTGRQSFINHTRESWQSLSMEIPKTQVDEVRIESFESFFNHSFARPGAPDDKNWDYTDSEVTKIDSEIELASTTDLATSKRGNYPAGSEAIPGVAFRFTGQPTAGSGRGGYFTASNGVGAGEDATDSFVFLRKGGTEKKVYRSDWNGHRPNERVWANNRPVITRIPHLFYGGGDLEVRALLHGETKSKLKTLHTFTPENVDDTFPDGPPFDQPNLPVQFSTDGLSGGSLRANAAHYEFGEVESENRVNGEHFEGVEVSTSGWTPLLIWQKKPGWEMVNVEPNSISVTASGADLKLALQLNPSVSGETTSLTTNSTDDETAVEIVDITNGSFDSPGERRWVGYAAAGSGNQAGETAADNLDFNLPSQQKVALVAQATGSGATASGFASWEEFF